MRHTLPDIPVAMKTAWGAEIIADPSQAIGYSILANGIYDLAVSEALARLIGPKSLVVDAGANIGYMSVLARYAAINARIVAFEPHPATFAMLVQNTQGRAIEQHQLALGPAVGTAELEMPTGFESNDGLARIVTARNGQPTITVEVTTLDRMFRNIPIDVLKLDVEGFELKVLEGAKELLRTHSLRHIVFEDHHSHDSEVITLLRRVGYTVFALGWRMRGPQVRALEQGSLVQKHDAANFIATVEPDTVLERMRRPGWRVLRRLG
jgi:FkbM family methyltransferase